MSERRTSTGLVELIRLTVVVASTAGGYEIARSFSEEGSGRIVLGALLGSALGYVAGGMFGRTVGRLVGAAERSFASIPGADLVAGGLGMTVGLVGGAALGWPLLFVPVRSVTLPALAFVLITSGYLGYRVGASKREDLLQLFGLTFRTRAADLRVLDTSAILDVRLFDAVRAGLVRGTVLVPQFVLEEVQSIADSADQVKRGRGRRGLEAINALKAEGLLDVRVVDRAYPEYEHVDAKVVALARDRGASIVTNDTALGRIAELQGIEVLSLATLASVIRPAALPGESVEIALVKAGKEPGQGVGYLDDGSMVVVADAASAVGRTERVRVTSIVQTAGGRMLFGRLAASADGAGDPAGGTAEPGAG